MNLLFLACTYYQLITCIQIKKKMYSNDSAVLLLTDDCADADKVIRNLSNESTFENCFLLRKKHYYNEKTSITDKLKHISYSTFGSKEFSFLEERTFDKFFLYNDDFYSLWIFATVSKRNKKITLERYEEGLISYYVPENKADTTLFYRVSTILRKLIGKPLFFNQMKVFYCFNSYLYHGTLHVIEIPEINTSDKEMIVLLKNVFGIEEQSLHYEQKYIFLSSMIDSDGDGIPGGELEVIKNVTKLVGKDRVLVKVHPRDDIEKFTREDILVDDNSSVPFEIIQLLYDFSEKVLITVLSGGVLTISSIINSPPSIIFTNKLYPKQDSQYLSKWGPQYQELINEIKAHKSIMINMVNDLDELKQVLSI